METNITVTDISYVTSETPEVTATEVPETTSSTPETNCKKPTSGPPTAHPSSPTRATITTTNAPHTTNSSIEASTPSNKPSENPNQTGSTITSTVTGTDDEESSSRTSPPETTSVTEINIAETDFSITIEIPEERNTTSITHPTITATSEVTKTNSITTAPTRACRKKSTTGPITSYPSSDRLTTNSSTETFTPDYNFTESPNEFGSTVIPTVTSNINRESNSRTSPPETTPDIETNITVTEDISLCD
ncbi:hypothetical protein GDO81_003249 [Engystomops pustulosus]|uniref:Uncharacterized protein n=1 Tax=Engystomops pustulosus TaxID=76066 RepID=A0AAV6ZZX6_ENGPU|nr:hypothetical protein GDO81_003249 [Engystomops pustulosus]